MLAFRFADHFKSLTYPLILQPKLNGVRALYHRSTFQSRDEHLWRPSVLLHLERALHLVTPPSLLLDGELYHHGWPLQRINGAVSVNRNDPSPQTKMVQYHVFDVINTEDVMAPMTKRMEWLKELEERLMFQHLSEVRVVPTLLVSEAEAEGYYSRWINAGYEGSMYRKADAPYGFAENCGNKENRWKCLLKRKDWLDEDFEVVGWEEGTNTHEGKVGALILQMENGARFTAGTGLSEAERERFVHALPQKVKVKFMQYSEGGIPLQPTIEMIYE